MMTFISAEIKESFATERNLNRSLTLRDLSETKSGAGKMYLRCIEIKENTHKYFPFGQNVTISKVTLCQFIGMHYGIRYCSATIEI